MSVTVSDGRTFFICVNEYVYVCVVKPYDILKIKNALNSIKDYTICSLVCL